MELSLPLIAGSISTVIFALSTLPMLLKAIQTRDLKSYSLGNILLSNLGNVIHSLYVFSLPPGPIWLLHAFYLVTTGLMLLWYLRYEWRPFSGAEPAPARSMCLSRSETLSRSIQRVDFVRAMLPRKVYFWSTSEGLLMSPFGKFTHVPA
jgi:hypothetical protein